MISNFAPINHLADAQELSDTFFCALELARGHIQRLLQRQKLVSQSRDLVRQAMACGKHYLVLDQSIPWIENFFSLSGQRHPACFVIMPSGEHWKLRGIPRFADQKMDLRMPLPSQWAGRMNADLQAITGIPGALFCHKRALYIGLEDKRGCHKRLRINPSQKIVLHVKRVNRCRYLNQS